MFQSRYFHNNSIPVMTETLGEEKILDTTTLDPQLFKSMPYLTQLLDTFTLIFSRGGAYLPLRKHDKDKMLWFVN